MGFIKVFYNYVKVSPVDGSWEEHVQLHELLDEKAEPGWYACTLGQTGIYAETTVARMTAVHRYRFRKPKQARIVVDFGAGGLLFDNTTPKSGPSEVMGCGNRTVSVKLLKEGVPLFAHVFVSAAADIRIIEASKGPVAIFDLQADETEVRVGFSCKSIERAVNHLDVLSHRSFEQIRTEAGAQWEKALSAVNAEFETQAEASQFRSMMYHAFKKPCDLTDENPFGDWPFYSDLATLWDMYKTQLPLVTTLFPSRAADIVNAFLDTAGWLGFFPNAILMADNFQICTNQARGLFHNVVADAFFRRVPGIDYRRALRAMKADLEYETNTDFRILGRTEYPVHTLDLSCACHAAAAIANALGETDLFRYFSSMSGNWRNVMKSDGLLDPAVKYYEGCHRNYSFRILPDMAARMALFGSVENFVGALDDFFGFGAPPVEQAGSLDDPETDARMKEGTALGRFEGLNNEPDMDSPYNYLWAGRHDRLCEVVRSAMSSVYGLSGRGALPGNDDSGALTSWFVWNAVGIFPLTGRRLFLIGSPTVKCAQMQTGQASFEIVAEEQSSNHWYVKRAFLNGKEIQRAWLTMEEVMSGGTLRVVMGDSPGEFGRAGIPEKEW